MQQTMAFVDIETTGTNAQRDAITEIAVVLWDGETMTQWQSLINPQTPIPLMIQRLTGINNDMVASAPVFSEIAQELHSLLQNKLFVAHNARFDYAFLKQAFKREGLEWSSKQLCTVKLSRRLFPEHKRHGLSELISRFDLDVSQRHRAMGDAMAIFQFWQLLNKRFDAPMLQQTCTALISRPSLPPHLQVDWDNIPNSYGVYLIYGDNDMPVYVGKSKHVKTRLLSHFSQDVHNSKEMSLSQQARRIEVKPCAGEIDALITESLLVKNLQPLLNRQLRRKKDLFSWQIVKGEDGYDVMHLVSAEEMDLSAGQEYVSLFHARKDALAFMKQRLENSPLCLQVLQLEKGSKGKPCFRFQLKRCAGACVGQMSAEAHNQLLREVLADARVENWPFKGKAVIQEQDVWHVIDRWVYLGRAKSAKEIKLLCQKGKGKLDKDVYQILYKHRHLLQEHQHE